MLGITSLSLITLTAAKAMRTPGLPPHIRTAAMVLGAAGWMQVRECSFTSLSHSVTYNVNIVLKQDWAASNSDKFVKEMRGH